MSLAKSPSARRAGGLCAVAAAAALTVAGCSDGSGEPAEPAADAGASQRPSGEAAESAVPAEEPAGGGATAHEAVAAWVAAIVGNRPVDACLAMGTADGDGPPTANTAAMCEGDSPAAEQARQGVSAFHASFTPRDAGASPVVEVAESPQSGGTAAFDGQQVTVDGQTLEDVVVANSTGVEPGRIALGIVATEIDGRWYVTDLSLSFG